MRLSLGQDLRLVQKQVLAPRMIQSMEILQLPDPRLAGADRAGDGGEPHPGVAGGGARAAGRGGRGRGSPAPDAPTEEERELVIDETHANEGDFERLMKMDEEWPDHFEERSHGPRAAKSRRPASGRPTRWPTWSPGRSRCKTTCTTSWAGSTSSPACGRWPTASSTISTPTAIFRAGLKICSVQTPTRSKPPWPNGRWPWCKSSTRRGVGARDLRECLLLQLVPGVPYYEELRTLIANHLEDLEHNRLPVISHKTGYSIELIQKVLGELRKLNPKPGADYNNVAVPPVTPDVFVELGRGRQVSRAA